MSEPGAAELIERLLSRAAHDGKHFPSGGTPLPHLDTSLILEAADAFALKDTQLQALREERDAAHAHACENSLEERNLRAQLQALTVRCERAEAALHEQSASNYVEIALAKYGLVLQRLQDEAIAALASSPRTGSSE